VSRREAPRIHNENIGPLLSEVWRLSGRNISELNVFAESLLLGVARLNFPDDPRRQALIIQEIADGAQDRTTGGVG